MSSIKLAALIAVSGAALTLSAAGAQAADLLGKGVVSAPEPAVIYDDNQFDWNRFYAGLSLGGQEESGSWDFLYGLQAGVNAQFDFYLLGGEVAISGLSDSTTTTAYGQVLARGGLVVTDETVVYAAAGYGGNFNTGDQHILAGGGLEYAVSDNVSVRGQYLHGFANTAASADINQVTFGLNYHF
jgi:outer membrane immunogenic protein